MESAERQWVILATKNMSQRVGLFGGSFDPIHFGHLSIARAVRERLQLDKIVFLPSSSPPHKRSATLAPIEQRIAMIRLAIETEPAYVLNDYDSTRPEPTYTVKTIAHFREALGEACDLFWIIGWDSFLELPTWRNLPELVERCQLITAARRDARAIDWRTFEAQLTSEQIDKLKKGVLDTPLVDVSSTRIRQAIRCRASIETLVPAPVANFIYKHNLYAAGGT